MPDPEIMNLRYGLEKAPERNPNTATNFLETDSITTKVPTVPILSNRKSMGGPVIYIRTSTPRNIYTVGTSKVMPMDFITRVQLQPTQNSTGLNLSLSHPTMKTRSIDYKANESIKTKKNDEVNRINEMKLDLNNSNTTNETKNYVNIDKSGRNNTKVANFGLLNVILETTSHEAEYVVIRDMEYFDKSNESFSLPVNSKEKKNISQHLFDNKFMSSTEILNNMMTKQFNDYRSETKIDRPHFVMASN